MKDLGSFSIPCVIGTTSFERALCDLGASVILMPLSIYEKLGLGEMMSTRIPLQLKDMPVKYPLGVVKDVPTRIVKLIIPADFVMVDIEEDSKFQSC